MSADNGLFSTHINGKIADLTSIEQDLLINIFEMMAADQTSRIATHRLRNLTNRAKIKADAIFYGKSGEVPTQVFSMKHRVWASIDGSDDITKIQLGGKRGLQYKQSAFKYRGQRIAFTQINW